MVLYLDRLLMLYTFSFKKYGTKCQTKAISEHVPRPDVMLELISITDGSEVVARLSSS